MGDATVNNSYQVSLLSAKDYTKDDVDTGNIFIADNYNHGIPKDTSRIKLHWLSKDSLKISYNNGLRVFKKKDYLANTIIIYDSLVSEK